MLINLLITFVKRAACVAASKTTEVRRLTESETLQVMQKAIGVYISLFNRPVSTTDSASTEVCLAEEFCSSGPVGIASDPSKRLRFYV